MAGVTVADAAGLAVGVFRLVADVALAAELGGNVEGAVFEEDPPLAGVVVLAAVGVVPG